ncbi:MAG: hypothetical protein H6983_17765 [Ectothiorhodospiraceae bacterium]|nr:hypothetical protein [Chromatiales bacterium]MCP5156024.1 hypothetical protein [Ectothiorhodospiraceae bacterium]
MRLVTLQRQLERIYEIEIPHDVDDFVITDRVVARSIEGDDARDAPEKLLVRQSGDEVDIALYLDREVVERLGRDDPNDHLHGGNFADLCTALEGVSHFLYLAWNAGHDRGVSLLELEMQAEVDKYVTTAFLFGAQEQGRVPGWLHRRLFEDASFDSQLDETELARYRDANRYASRFCSHLESRYLRGTGEPGLMNELRRFYRLPQRAKIRRIEGTR